MSTFFLQDDIFKKQITQKLGITIMVIVSLLLLLIIFSNFYSIFNYDKNSIIEIFLKENKKKPTLSEIDSYVRGRILFWLISNTLILGFFSSMVWWSISKKRFGIFFNFFWFIVFLGKAISTPYYSFSTRTMNIIIIIFHSSLAIIMFYLLIDLLKTRSRLKQNLASKGK